MVIFLELGGGENLRNPSHMLMISESVPMLFIYSGESIPEFALCINCLTPGALIEVNDTLWLIYWEKTD